MIALPPPPNPWGDTAGPTVDFVDFTASGTAAIIIVPSADDIWRDEYGERETPFERRARLSREATARHRIAGRAPRRYHPADPVTRVRFRPQRVGRALGEAWRVTL
jgi:hypothetical protein